MALRTLFSIGKEVKSRLTGGSRELEPALRRRRAELEPAAEREQVIEKDGKRERERDSFWAC